MAKKAAKRTRAKRNGGKDPSKMSDNALMKFIKGSGAMLAAMQRDMKIAEANVRIYRAELSKRMGLNGHDAPAAPPTHTGKGKAKTAKKGGEPSASDVEAIKAKVLEELPQTGKGLNAGDVRKKLKVDSRLVELAFAKLRDEEAIKPADEKERGRFRRMLKV